MDDRISVGNLFAPECPPHHFNNFLVGSLANWAAKKQPEAVREAALDTAQRYPLLDVSGKPLADCELKVGREYTGKVGPAKPDSDHGPFSITVGVVTSGAMSIELISRASAAARLFDLGPGDFLAWPGSVYKHTWKCVSEAIVVTLRWREDGIRPDGTPLPAS